MHNLNWEVAFGRAKGHTTQQSVRLFLEPEKIPPELLTTSEHEWTSDTIMADFVNDGFLQMMDDINHSVDIPPA